jgi:hypothetical protein
MDDVRNPELTKTMPDLGPLVQVSSDATRRLCEHGQSVAKTINEWNTGVSHFLSHRAARNNETIGRMAKCQNLPEILATQAQWVQETADDYLKEMSKLMEVNSRTMGGLLGSFGRFEVQLAEQPSSSLAKVPRGAAN